MKLSQLAAIINGTLLGSDTTFQGVSIDSRTLKPQELFAAIKGNQFDGHNFASAVQEKSAAAVLVERAMDVTIPQLLVPNVIKALGQFAAFHRQQFNIPVIAITGSCGKTTVKALTASILAQCGPVLFSESSFNNDIGLPLTLLKLKPEHQYAVIEMGTNHFGEIAYLTEITRPTVATITNAAAAHLEGLESIEGVSRAKGEIFQGLTQDGIAIINADDTYADYWDSLVSQHKTLHFGLAKGADISAKNIRLDEQGRPQFTLLTPQGEIDINLPLLGRHNVHNALTAAACALAVQAPLTAIQQGLNRAAAVSKRLNEYQGCAGARVIDDSYNANPLSVKAALEMLATAKGEKVLVLGDMKELGSNAEHYHRELGATAQRLGIEQLYAYGELSQLAAESFGAKAQHFSDQSLLISALKSILHPQMTILVKGSRSMHMEQVVAAIVQK